MYRRLHGEIEAPRPSHDLPTKFLGDVRCDLDPRCEWSIDERDDLFTISADDAAMDTCADGVAIEARVVYSEGQ
jgi:hypothetical protein